MPGFCSNCGAPISGPFCSACGSRAAQMPQAPQAAQPQPPSTAAAPAAAPQPPGSPERAGFARPGVEPVVPAAAGASKGLLIVAGLVLLLGLVALGAVFYGAWWVKGKISGVTGGSSSSVQVASGHACDLLSTADLQQVLGVTVERSSEIMEGNEPGCAYFTNPQAFADLQKLALDQARRDSERASKDPSVQNSKSDNPLALLSHTEEMEGMVKGLGMSQPDKDGKVFSFTVDRNFGHRNWGTLRAPLSVVPGFKEIDGVGDHAMLGSFGHTFLVLKGDSLIRLNTMYVPETRIRGAEIARKMLSH